MIIFTTQTILFIFFFTGEKYRELRGFLHSKPLVSLSEALLPLVNVALPTLGYLHVDTTTWTTKDVFSFVFFINKENKKQNAKKVQ